MTEPTTAPARGEPGRTARGGGRMRREPAARLPVARVAVDNPLPHLDHPFDYLVPAALDATAVPGCRVRVRFAGKLTDGFLLERVDRSDHRGRLAPIERVISPEPVLTPEIAGLARAVADHYAGTLADVLRLAVPPRHARVEAEPRVAVPREDGEGRRGQVWAGYPVGESFLRALEEGRSPRAVWGALPGMTGHLPDWPVAVAEAVDATLSSGRGAVVVVPDGKDVALVDTALTAVLGTGRHVALTADLGPAERYRRWLRLLRGQIPAVVGTRAAMFAPVRDLGLAVIWDDGDDLHAERLAPYPHAREVLVLRAHRAGAGMLIGGHARTAEAARLIAQGWARPLTASRETIRRRAPRVRPTGDDHEMARDEAARLARLPSLAWRTLKQGLTSGPVLVQVPRRGYLPVLACHNCRARARCVQSPPGVAEPRCGGPLALRSGHATPECRWCGRISPDWHCPNCGSPRLRGVVVGARRTAEELGRAFPSVPVRTSGRDGVLARVGPAHALIVATPGAEPVAEGGYAAGVLLDGWALLGRPDLRAWEEALRRWMNAAALLRPGAELVVLADAAVPAVQALLRWDPATHAERELSERIELAFPPAVRLATLTGTPAALREMLAQTRLPQGAQVLGPAPLDLSGPPGDVGDVRERVLIRAPRERGGELVAALKAAGGVRSARKAAEVVRVCVDPVEGI